MGTINYAKSNYITIGLKPYDPDDFILEDGSIDYDAMNFEYEADYDNIKWLLDNYSFRYFHVAIKHGYYEGFYIDIEANYPLCYDCWEDKREAQKEVTQLKEFLLSCINMGLYQVHPWWCTTYDDRADSIKGVEAAVKVIRQEIRETPTWYTANRLGVEL